MFERELERELELERERELELEHEFEGSMGVSWVRPQGGDPTPPQSFL